MKRNIIIIFILLILLICGGSSKKDAKSETIKIEHNTEKINFHNYKDVSGAKVFFVYDNNGVLYKFIVYGSTNYDEYGKDIVAAGLSSLSINTVNSLIELTDIDVKYSSKKVNNEPYLECYIDKFINKAQQDDFNLLVESFRLGAKGLVETYGSQYVEVIDIN